MYWRILDRARALRIGSLLLAFLIPSGVTAERLSATSWQVLAVAFPADRTVAVALGGTEKTLTARGLSTVKFHDKAATLEVEIDDLATPTDLGWSGEQYVLWAVDSDQRVVNLGLVPMNGKRAKWKLQAPFRIFGLIVSAEKNQQATAPSNNVVLESRLPTDPDLVVPVFRVDIALTK
jgi:hypothetical protein